MPTVRVSGTGWTARLWPPRPAATAPSAAARRTGSAAVRHPPGAARPPRRPRGARPRRPDWHPAAVRGEVERQLAERAGLQQQLQAAEEQLLNMQQQQAAAAEHAKDQRRELEKQLADADREKAVPVGRLEGQIEALTKTAARTEEHAKDQRRELEKQLADADREKAVPVGRLEGQIEALTKTAARTEEQLRESALKQGRLETQLEQARAAVSAKALNRTVQDDMSWLPSPEARNIGGSPGLPHPHPRGGGRRGDSPRLTLRPDPDLRGFGLSAPTDTSGSRFRWPSSER
eukprot:TRINITY_DN145_c0_g2_i4.p1 TRINITY_DN145_c0_g2~~TRINITY_DN145_c0_g2_i4.p1  ORF type:complete len:290 (+),score=64.58 TRINITY_DN145_c0_g2_i4:73-942(+)